MRDAEVRRAVAAAMSTASACNLAVDDATVVQDSNRLVVHLLPCDAIARVADAAHGDNAHVAAFEVQVAQQLTEAGSPVGALDPRFDPRVYVCDRFAVTMWTYYEPVSPPEVEPAEYAEALQRLHTGMRRTDVTAPHFTDRVAEAQGLLGSRDLTPELSDDDRELLRTTLRDMTHAIVDRGAPEQLLHGEPHPGNLLRTSSGLLFIDLETCCRGPVEFDIAHASYSHAIDGVVPDEVGKHYPGADPHLIRECQLLMLAMVAVWRWHRDDHLPNGQRAARRLLGQIRAASE